MTSATGVVDAERSTVLSPGAVGASGPVSQKNLNCTSVGEIGAVGVIERMNVWAWLRPRFTGVLTVPVTVLVPALVVWKVNVAGMALARAIRHPITGMLVVLMTVANTVAVAPTWTERLFGRMAAERAKAGDAPKRTSSPASHRFDALPIRRRIGAHTTARAGPWSMGAAQRLHSACHGARCVSTSGSHDHLAEDLTIQEESHGLR